jgi:hypothetical protein
MIPEIDAKVTGQSAGLKIILRFFKLVELSEVSPDNKMLLNHFHDLSDKQVEFF